MVTHREHELDIPGQGLFVRAPRLGYGSPWGVIDHVTDIAEGIVSVGTPSHGGVWLGPERMAQFRVQFPLFQTFAGGPWFEEDEDWIMVVLAFPDHYNPHQIWGCFNAFKQAGKRTANFAAQQGWLETAQGQRCHAIALRYELDHRNDWQRGSCGTMSGRARGDYRVKGWWVEFIRIGDGTRREVVMPDYPEKPVYTDAELEAFEPVAA